MSQLSFALPAEYWQNLVVTTKDIETLQNVLFENEQPHTTPQLVRLLVAERIRSEVENNQKKQKDAGEVYLPANAYSVGQKVLFPALNFATGKVLAVRGGQNPDLGSFDVMDVSIDGITRCFASNLENHKLNRQNDGANDPSMDIDAVCSQYTAALDKKLNQALSKDGSLAQIAHHWFPEALLVNINKGNLNLAEAILEMNDGKPMTTAQLMEQMDLDNKENATLLEFSVNYALLQDGRFDEVGPVGEVLWFLKRLEPDGVQKTPFLLQYNPVDYDRSQLNAQDLQFEEQMDDELGEVERADDQPEKATITLNFPHWRSGTLPISARNSNFFPTSLEAPRILFSFVDEKTGEQFPAWVVRDHGYIFGLQKMFEKYKLIPGSVLQLRKGKKNGEILVDVKARKAAKEWIRTVLAGSDGGLVFAILRQEVNNEYDERLAMALPDLAAVDAAAELVRKSTRRPERVIRDVVVELSKLNPQGHVHAEEIYSAVNILMRIPPAPLLAILNTSDKFTHVGDLHYRVAEATSEE